MCGWGGGGACKPCTPTHKRGTAKPHRVRPHNAHTRHAIPSFGAVASMLNQVPVLNWGLGLTNSVGAALWAASLEKKGGRIFGRH